VEAKCLSIYFSCADCNRPIVNEEDGYTLRERGSGRPLAFFCQSCGEKRIEAARECHD